VLSEPSTSNSLSNMSVSPTCCSQIHRCRRRRHVASTCCPRRHVALGYIDVAGADMLPQHVALADMLPSDTSMSLAPTCCLNMSLATCIHLKVASGRRRRLLLATSCQRFKLLNLWRHVAPLFSLRS